MRAGVGRDQADDHVERGRLAGAVGAEQTDDLALVETEFEVAYDRAPTKTLAQSGRTQHQCVSLPCFGGGAGAALASVGAGGFAGAGFAFGWMTMCTRLALLLSPLSISPVFVL